ACQSRPALRLRKRCKPSPWPRPNTESRSSDHHSTERTQTRPSTPMKPTAAPTRLSEICAFRAIDHRLGTGGQPTEEQFGVVRDSGYEAVINLALATSDNALANEGSVVAGLGMSYVHI